MHDELRRVPGMFHGDGGMSEHGSENDHRYSRRGGHHRRTEEHECLVFDIYIGKFLKEIT